MDIRCAFSYIEHKDVWSWCVRLELMKIREDVWKPLVNVAMHDCDLGSLRPCLVM